jgi:hypothetical protein
MNVPGDLVPITICCFGRGGSSMIWNIIGSSPDVLMMSKEWHQAVFEHLHLIRRGLRMLTTTKLLRPSRTGLRAIADPFARPIMARTLRAIDDQEYRSKPGAKFVSVKVMDYSIAFFNLIEAAFPDVRPVILVRHPLAQCESLLRSGLSVREACRWYSDVMSLMWHVKATRDVSLYKFEDLVAAPAEFVAKLYRELNLAEPVEDAYRLKEKAFGSDRNANIDASRNNYVWLRLDALSGFIDEDVNQKAYERLRPRQREEIWAATAERAVSFGYSETMLKGPFA